MKCNFPADLKFQWAVSKRGHGSHAGRFCHLCPVSADMKGRGQPGGCDSCIAANCVYDGNGKQICTHWDLCTPAVQRRLAERLDELKTRLGVHPPIKAMPRWKTDADLKRECEKRGLLPDKRRMTGEAMQNLLMDFCCSSVSLRGKDQTNIATTCAANLDLELGERKMEVAATASTDEKSRLLRKRLYEEEEYLDLVHVFKDFKFKLTDTDHIYTDVERQIMCVLHAVMRMHEKIINLL